MQEYKTQTNIDKLSILLPKLKLITIKQYNDPFSRYLHSRYDSKKILIEDQIQFCEEEQYLKRFYDLTEYSTKIQLLSEYYKYHFEVPRIFIPSIEWIMEENYDDKRQLQYIKVMSKMAKQNNNQKLNINTQFSQNVLDQLQLSSTSTRKNLIEPQRQITNHQKTLKRVVSVHCKDLFGIQPKQGLFVSNRKNIKKQQQNRQLNGHKVNTMKSPKQKPQIKKNNNLDTQKIQKISTSKSKMIAQQSSLNQKIVKKVVLSKSTSRTKLVTAKPQGTDRLISNTKLTRSKSSQNVQLNPHAFKRQQYPKAQGFQNLFRTPVSDRVNIKDMISKDNIKERASHIAKPMFKKIIDTKRRQQKII